MSLTHLQWRQFSVWTDAIVGEICNKIDGIVVPAYYNSPGQIVISGTIDAIDKAIEAMTNAGAKRAIKLNVGGAFHSPLMQPAKLKLEKAINSTNFAKPICPVYQNVTATAVSDPEEIKKNLIAQLTAPVRWAEIAKNMINDGAVSFTEVGPGRVLQGLIKKVDRKITTKSA